MASFRHIDPAMRRSKSISQLSYRQRDLWMGLILTADDQGRRESDEALIRSDVWPYEDINLSEITMDLLRLQQDKFILLYEADGKKLLQILNWHKYQSQAEWLGLSKFPPPQGWQDRYRYHGKAKTVVTSSNWSTYSLGSGLPANDVNGDVNVNDDSDIEEEHAPSSPVVAVSPDDWQPETPLNYESYKAVEKENTVLLDNIFMGVTSFYPTKDAPACRRAIQLICERRNIPLSASNSEKIKDVLQPFFTTWCKRKGQNGNYYSKTNSTWLTEWAVLGEIPAATTGKKEKTVADVIPQQTEAEKEAIKDILRKSRQEKPIPIEIPVKVDA